MVKLKAVSAIVINGGEHANPSGKASVGVPGSNILDFGTYILGDSNALEANATIYLDNVNLADETLRVTIDPTVQLKNSAGGNFNANISLNKSEIGKGDVTDNSVFINLRGIIPTPNSAIVVDGEYGGTVAITVAIN